MAVVGPESEGSRIPSQELDDTPLRSVLANLKEVVFQTDVAGHWTFLNPAWTGITGFSVSEALGRSYLEYVHPEDRVIAQTEDQPGSEIRYLHADGGFRWMEVHAQVLLDREGNAAGTFGTLSDITECRELDEHMRSVQDRLAFLLASNPAVVFQGMLVPGWPVTYCSHNITAVLGYTRSEILSRPANWPALIHPDDTARIFGYLTELVLLERVQFECRGKHRDGRYRWLQCEIRLNLRDEESPAEFIGCISDITSLKEATLAVERRETILQAVSDTAKRFLHAGNWESELPEALRELCLAAEASQVRLFEGRGDECGLGKLRHQWRADPAEAPPGRGVKEEVIPVMAGGQSWGWIVFDYPIGEDLPRALVAPLKAAADIIGAAIGRQRSEQALRQREAVLQSIARALPLGFSVIDEQADRVLYLNERFCDIWRLAAENQSVAPGQLKSTELQVLQSRLVSDQARFLECASGQGAGGVVEDEIAFSDGRTIRRITTPIHVAAGAGSERLFLFEDITGRKRSEEELQSTRRRLEFLLSSSPTVIVTADPRTYQTTWMSEKTSTLLGYPPAEFLRDGEFWRKRLHPDDREATELGHRRLEETGSATLQSRFLHQDGTWRFIRSDLKLVRGGDGQPLEVVGSMLDVTEAAQVFQALQRREAILEAIGFTAGRLFHTTDWRQEAPFTLERLGRAAGARRAVLLEREHAGDLSGGALVAEWCSPDPPRAESRDSSPGQRRISVPVFAGDTCWGLIALDDASDREWSSALVEALRTAAGILGAAIRRAGAEQALRDAHAELERRVLDRTRELASANASLEESARLYRTLIETSPEAILFSDPDDRILVANQQAADLFGMVEAEDLLGRTICDFAVPAHRAAIGQMLGSVLGENVVKGREFDFERSGGQRFTVELSAALIEGSVRSARFVLCVLRDVTPRKQAAEAVERSERRFHAVFDEAPIGITLLDRGGRCIEANHFFRRMFGYSGEELRLAPYATITGLEQDGAAQSLFQQSLGAMDRAVRQSETTCRIRNGAQVWVRTTVAGLETHGDDLCMVAMIEDITSRKQLEDQFRHAQKMEAIGRLAGGVAHDFNNLLTVIKGYSELLVKRIPEQDPSGKKIRQIIKAADRASALVQQLLAFSRKQNVEPKVIGVNQAILELEKMLRRLIGEHIELLTELDPGAGNIQIDPGQFDQMFMNLVVNARDAVVEGGRITLSTARMTSGRPLPFHTLRDDLDYVMLSVADNGIGIPAENHSKIFEPFFTTKDVGKGTGLGLSTVYGIVEQSGGHILVESSPGAGTTFRIYLPAVASGAADSPVEPAFHLPVAGKATILVVEDEELVRALVTETLHDAGYTVLEASNGNEAMRVSGNLIGEIDLLLTDVMMPGMGGEELWQKLEPRRPASKVLFMSAYTDREIPGALLHKPFSTEALLARVRELLAGPGVSEQAR